MDFGDIKLSLMCGVMDGVCNLLVRLFLVMCFGLDGIRDVVLLLYWWELKSLS